MPYARSGCFFSKNGGGLLACIEVNRKFENAGFCVEGLAYSSLDTTPLFQGLWERELAGEGRDYAIAMKLPFLCGTWVWWISTCASVIEPL